MSLESLIGVIVLYKCHMEKSETIIALNIALEKIQKQLTLLVYDNGPKAQYAEHNFKYGNLNIVYIHDPTNPGLSKAYNAGLDYANSHDAEWILLLDQDTLLPPEFLEQYLHAVKENSSNEIVCIMPRILSVSNDTIVSPSRIYRGGITRPLNKIKPGIIKESVTGINSGTFLSIQFMISLGGFCDDFPLDMLDHWYFREIAKKKRKILLLDISIQHYLSVDSFFDEVSTDRYESILLSERRFFNHYFLDLCIYKIRLALRIVKQLRLGEKTYATLTFKYLFK